jgi:hypothetical protein
VVLSKWIRGIESASPGQTFKTFETLKKALKLVFKGQEQMAECCQQVLKKKIALLVPKYQYWRRWPNAVSWCYCICCAKCSLY